jgi:hypothetical protein
VEGRASPLAEIEIEELRYWSNFISSFSLFPPTEQKGHTLTRGDTSTSNFGIDQKKNDSLFFIHFPLLLSPKIKKKEGQKNFQVLNFAPFYLLIGQCPNFQLKLGVCVHFFQIFPKNKKGNFSPKGKGV